jgi:hypothetical protein
MLRQDIMVVGSYKNKITIISVVSAFIIPLIPLTEFVWAQSPNTNIFPIDSRPYNSTYGEWSAKWWIWVLSIPEDNNPVTDPTGEKCAINQEGPVWFLAGTTGGSVNRECDVPAGKAILFSPLNIECSFAEFPAMKTEQELRDCAQWPGASVKASIDGKNIEGIEQFKVQSPLFDVTLPESNIFGAPAGPTKAVSGGWWVLIKPLSPGNHQLNFGGSVVDNPTTGTQSFATEAMYNLNVK